MDRAHRLGQRRTVNVYRLLTRDSLEDKIMGLQRFKLDVANSVVNQDNVSLKTMDAGRLLDLFTMEKDTKAAGGLSCCWSVRCSCCLKSDTKVWLKSDRWQAYDWHNSCMT